MSVALITISKKPPHITASTRAVKGQFLLNALGAKVLNIGALSHVIAKAQERVSQASIAQLTTLSDMVARPSSSGSVAGSKKSIFRSVCSGCGRYNYHISLHWFLSSTSSGDACG